MRESYVIASIERGTTLFANRCLYSLNADPDKPWQMLTELFDSAIFFDTVEGAVEILNSPNKWFPAYRPQLHTFKVYKVSLEEVKL